MTSTIPSLHPAAPTAAPVVATHTALGRACRVEARKCVDTPAAAVLLALACLVPALFAVGRVAVPVPDLSLGRLAAMAIGSQGTPLALIAILLMSAEFSVPTAPSTFVLEPRRHVVVLAKALVMSGLVVVGACEAIALGVLACYLAPGFGSSASWHADPASLLAMTAGNLVITAAGLALALCLRNAPAPMLVILVWPTAALLLGRLMPSWQPALRLLELPPLDALLAPQHDVLAVVVAVGVWVVLPVTAGCARLSAGDL